MPKMIVSRANMKRKRKDGRALILEDSPKRTKVHAQRKFAQGSNVNSPVITPVEELETAEGSGTRLVSDPVELLPIKRPNTEDFLTFLCFRGTPLLPPNLNFFNTASIVDTNGQVHEIKSESPKNGPIDTSIIAKSGCGSSDRPFIAFGVRKRADPVVISRQMDKKRRHALALQALRRKYQEQKMAKIRAVTISKLSEKVTNKTLVRTNSISKAGTVTKKSTVQKTKVIATKRVKVITRTVKTTLRPKIQPKMCLRSFRGRFVQKELPFRNKNARKKPPPPPVRRIIKKVEEKKVVIKKNRRSLSSEFSSEDNEPLATTSTTSKEIKRSPKVLIPKIDNLPQIASIIKKQSGMSKRVTRSEQVKTNIKQNIPKKKRILIPTTVAPLVKVRNLRSQTVLKSGNKTKPKRVVLVNETLTAVKSPNKRKIIIKPKPQIIKSVKSASDRVLRTPQHINEKIQRTTRRITRTQEKITSIKKPHIMKNTLRRPIKKEKIVELPPKKIEKINTKKTEECKIENPVEIEKPTPKVLKKIDKVNEQEKKSTERVTGKVTKEIAVKDKKIEAEKNVVSKEKNLKTSVKTEESSSEVVKKTVEAECKDKGDVKKETIKTRGPNERKIDKIKPPILPITKEATAKVSKKVIKSKADSETAVSENKPKADENVELPSKRESKAGQDTTTKSSKKLKSLKVAATTEMKLEQNKIVDVKSLSNVSNEKVVDKADLLEKPEVKEIKTEKKENIIVNNSESSEIKSVKTNDKSLTKTDKKEKLSVTEKISQPKASDKSKKVDKKTVTKPVEKDETQKKEIVKDTKEIPVKMEEIEQKVASSRPSRKTKEAAAIYMEILSHKLVNDSKIDDDNISIDSFPELPNVKRTEQRENEFRAKSSQKGGEECVSKATKLPKDPKCKTGPEEKIKNDEYLTKPRKGGSKRFPTTLTKIGNKSTSKEEQKNDSVDLNNTEVTIDTEKSTVEKEDDSKPTTQSTTSDSNKMSSKKPSAISITKRKKKTTEKSVDIDQEKIKEEIMREIQEKLGPIAPLYKEPKKKAGTTIFKRKSLMSDEEESESIESIRKKLKSTEHKLADSLSKNADSNGKTNETNDVKKPDNPTENKSDSKEVKLDSKEVVNVNKNKLKQVDKVNVTANLASNKSTESNTTDNKGEIKTTLPVQDSVNSKGNLKDSTEGPKEKIQNEPQASAIKEETKPEVNDLNKADEEVKSKEAISSSDTNNAEKVSDARTENTIQVEKHAHAENTKRSTRNLNQTKIKDNEDSDDSYHVDIKIPRKKQITRHKAPKLYRNFSESEESSLWDAEKEEKPVSTKAVLGKSISSGESDHSTTSHPDKKQDNSSGKAKKYRKTKSKVKIDHFSDSDEEPLSKLTHIKPSTTQTDQPGKSESEIKCANEKQDDVEDLTKKSVKAVKELKSKSKPQKQPPPESEDREKTVKPKRECAKRPQNYLPMFSSSDDEDQFFYGFDVENSREKTAKSSAVSVPTQPPADLSSKDIGRRFGKGKVNMSNEQIEQWLKDSVLAGNSIKKEDDEMLKFGENIPTETSLELPQPIDTQQLKTSLLNTEEKKDEKPKQTTPKLLSPSSDKIKLSFSSKNQSLDKKLIFRKEKISTTPNANAFSANNESSVYAFGEENEDLISTPFRRPVRRPSSTATSKSEEEGKGEDSLKIGQFRRPPVLKQDPKSGTKDSSSDDVFNLPENIANTEDSTNTISSVELVTHKSVDPKETVKSGDKASTSMIPPTNTVQKSKSGDYRNLKFTSRSFDRASETSEEGKYKVPSSPSASSSSSAKLYKRQPAKPKARTTGEVCNPISVPSFPNNCFTPMLVEAPTFYPVDKEFQDPLEYIEKIRHKAEEFGICRIIPPSSFKPECKVTDDMRFTAYNQHVHKMLHRWGPNFKEFMAIKKYLKTQNITLVQSPWIGGMEIDLPRLYQTVQSLGGLKEVIEKKKWPKVSEMMKIPKSAQDRVTKLDDIYCKYLLPYDTLSPAEREKLFDEVETEWAKRESKTLLKLQQNLTVQISTNDSDVESDNETEECIMKGRNMALNAFYRIARNTMSVWFKNSEPSSQEVEQEFWKHVTQKQNHICVHSGSIDSGSWGYGFAVSKNSPFARNGWNLKVLTNNSGSVLRSLGPIMGVTVPTLHVGMVYSACCWYRDPHSLPWIEYLHTGGSKIWYGIPDSASGVFHSALTKLVPNYCKNKTFWLASDTVMVPPSLLIENGVSLCRTVQEPGQFVVVFPKAFTSSVCTGYVVSESVYFAPSYWLKSAQKVFNDMRLSCESSMFSLDRLLLSIANDSRSSVDVLRQVMPLVKDMCDKEGGHRSKLKGLGLSIVEKLPPPEVHNPRKRKKLHGEEGDYECEICRMNLFVSMVVDTQDNGLYCIEHAIELVENKKVQITNCKLLYTYDDEELKGLTDKINVAIENKLQKKIPNKYYGMPTLLKS